MKKIFSLLLMMLVLQGCEFTSEESKNSCIDDYNYFLENTDVVLFSNYYGFLDYRGVECTAHFHNSSFVLVTFDSAVTYYNPCDSDPSAYYIIENWRDNQRP